MSQAPRSNKNRCADCPTFQSDGPKPALLYGGNSPLITEAVGPWQPSRISEMLELRPNCECCDRDLPPDSADARICSFECTFCRSCTEGVLGGRCINYRSELVARPR